MADKKITELSEKSSVGSGDLFVIVDNPSGTPITKKVVSRNVFGFTGGLSFVTNASAQTGTVLRSTLTANVSANVAGAEPLIAADFLVNATSGSSESLRQYALRATSALSNTTAQTTTEHAVAKFVLDVTNAASVISNTSVLHLEISTSAATRVSNVHTFVTFSDKAANSTSAQTLYLFDLGANGAGNVSFSSVNSNSLVMVTASNAAAGTANAAPTHKIKVKINGTNYWLFASTSSN